MDEEKLLEEMAKAFAPEFWAHENPASDIWDKANALTVEAARLRAATIRNMKPVLHIVRESL